MQLWGKIYFTKMYILPHYSFLFFNQCFNYIALLENFVAFAFFGLFIFFVLILLYFYIFTENVFIRFCPFFFILFIKFIHRMFVIYLLDFLLLFFLLVVKMCFIKYSTTLKCRNLYVFIWSDVLYLCFFFLWLILKEAWWCMRMEYKKVETIKMCLQWKE